MDLVCKKTYRFINFLRIEILFNIKQCPLKFILKIIFSIFSYDISLDSQE